MKESLKYKLLIRHGVYSKKPRKQKAILGHLIRDIESQHNTSLFNWRTAINKQHDIDKIHILISTKIFVTSSFLRQTQAFSRLLSVIAHIRRLRVNGMPKFVYSENKSVSNIQNRRKA